MFDLKKPCKSCPFLKEQNLSVGEKRLHEIIKGLLDDDRSTFICHNTIDYDKDVDANTGFMEVDAYKGHKQCAGAMIVLEKMRYMTVGMRIATVMGMYDRPALLKHKDDIIDPEDIGLGE
jgi:hypothetical protein